MSASWVAAAQRHIAEREYRASENGQGLQAPNRAHNLRSYFDTSGVRVHDRTAEGSPELLKLTLARVGRGEALASVAPGDAPVAHDARVEIRHGDIVEWYVNSPAGLEQGFTLEERPPGTGVVVLELDVAGARPALRGDEVVFETAGHRELQYGELRAVDAAGHALGARLEVSGEQRLRIAVGDAGATYPVVIDPTLTQAETLPPDGRLESDQANSLMGNSVAGAGDVNGDGHDDVIIGAPRYDAGQTDGGAAFVFLGGSAGIPDGNPVTAATQIDGNQGGEVFGGSVAGAGDMNRDGYDDVIVGAIGYRDTYYDGAAFVFLGSASGVASGGPASAAASLHFGRRENPYGFGGVFGQSVAGAGDVNGDGYADVIVGDPDYDNYNPNQADHSPEGAALVFLGSGSGVGSSSYIHSGIGSQWWSPVDFGKSVAGAGDVNGDGYGDVVVVASGLYTAFVFHGSASGISNASTAANAATQITGVNQAVAGAGDVNGDGYADVIAGAGEAAYVFHGRASGIASGSADSIAATQLTSDRSNSRFGWSVAGAGDANGDGFDDVVVGAPQYDDNPREGHAFLYAGSATGIASGGPETAAAHLRAPSDAQQPAQLGLGASVAGAGDVNGDGYADVIAGAPYYETGDSGQQAEGAAFVFLGGGAIRRGGSAPATPETVLQSDEESGHLGFSVAGAGDVDGDGYGDVIVGAPYFDAGQTNEGAAFVFRGSASGVAHGSPVDAATQLESDLAFANLGESVASAGDVNGDGYADVIVGDPNYQNGAAFVFLGSASGVADGNPATAATRLTASPAEMPTCPAGGNAGFGVSVASAGDVNGDGFDDVILGAPRYPPCSSVSGILGVGAAFVFSGSASGIADASSLTAATRIEGADQQGWLGASVAGAGDVNGDGFDDVIVGAPLYSAVESDEGAAFVFLGSALGVRGGSPATATAHLESNQARAQFGASVAGAGDVNGDGFADVIVGAPSYDKDATSDTNEGAVFVYHGNAAGVSVVPAIQLLSNQADSAFGVSVAGAGRVDADSFDDVLIGASRYLVSGVESGAGFLFRGGPLGISRRVVAFFPGSQNEERFAASLASAGDVDGDGHADIIIGASGHDAGQTDEGAAFVYLPEPGLALTLASGVALLCALRRRRGA